MQTKSKIRRTVTRLVLVRHGESKTTVARVIGGPRTCTGLSDLGRQQAERLRDRWSVSGEIIADVLICSHYCPGPRDRRDHRPGARRSHRSSRTPGFGEHDPGPDCDGMGFDDYVEQYGGGWWEGDPFGTSFPGGETIAAFQFRIGQTIRRTVGLGLHRRRDVFRVARGQLGPVQPGAVVMDRVVAVVAQTS